MYPNDEFLNLDAVTIDTNRTFDCIYSNKVLHHLKDKELEDSIKRQYRIVKSKGIICHSFWKGEDFEIFKGLYVNYQNEKKLKHFFKDYFEIISIISYQEFEEGDSLLVIGKKK
jgi:ubiquinone/menaquinone biosynthesis C-methylase UbiE